MRKEFVISSIGSLLISALFFDTLLIVAASAIEMLGISLCLSGGVKNDVESAFNQAFTCHLENNFIRLALRSQIYGCRALLCMDPVQYGKDAALKFDRLSCDIVVQETYPGPAPTDAESESLQRQLWVRHLKRL